MNHSDSSQHETAKYSFISGYTTAQQSQPMWREIEEDAEYHNVFVKSDTDWEYYSNIYGRRARNNNFTHYLSSDDLLKLPVKKK